MAYICAGAAYARLYTFRMQIIAFPLYEQLSSIFVVVVFSRISFVGCTRASCLFTRKCTPSNYFVQLQMHRLDAISMYLSACRFTPYMQCETQIHLKNCWRSVSSANPSILFNHLQSQKGDGELSRNLKISREMTIPSNPNEGKMMAKQNS